MPIRAPQRPVGGRCGLRGSRGLSRALAAVGGLPRGFCAPERRRSGARPAKAPQRPVGGRERAPLGAIPRGRSRPLAGPWGRFEGTFLAWGRSSPLQTRKNGRSRARAVSQLGSDGPAWRDSRAPRGAPCRVTRDRRSPPARPGIRPFRNRRLSRRRSPESGRQRYRPLAL
jgi:hypothetical protein